MLDEERIRLMTRMASYEENEGKKTIPIASYFRGDYISFNVVKAAISATIAFVLVAAAYIYYNMESFITDMYKLDFVSVGRQVLTAYLITVGLYCVAAYVLYSWRYDKAKKSLQGYYQALKKLSGEYEEDDE